MIAVPPGNPAGITSLADLDWIIVEPDGKFSFIERSPSGDGEGADEAEGEPHT